MLAEAVRSGGSQVTCIDVMIHYPEDKMSQMVSSLASHAEERLIISFAPNTWYYRALKSFGELFPGPSKTTRACEPYNNTNDRNHHRKFYHISASIPRSSTKAPFLNRQSP